MVSVQRQSENRQKKGEFGESWPSPLSESSKGGREGPCLLSWVLGRPGLPPSEQAGALLPSTASWSCEPRKRIHSAGELCAQTPKATVPTPSDGGSGDLGRPHGSVQRCSHAPEHPGFPPGKCRQLPGQAERR